MVIKVILAIGMILFIGCIFGYGSGFWFDLCIDFDLPSCMKRGIYIMVYSGQVLSNDLQNNGWVFYNNNKQKKNGKFSIIGNI